MYLVVSSVYTSKFRQLPDMFNGTEGVLRQECTSQLQRIKYKVENFT